jgi:SPP1 gp7 family putative phage head morphogenesis protein
MNLALQANPILQKYIADYAVKMSLKNREDRFRAEALPYERKYKDMLRETFSSQSDELSHAILAFKSKAFEDYMIDWEKYRIIYNEFGQLTLPDAMSNWGNIELEALEVGISFNVQNPYIREAIFTRANKFADTVVNTTREWLHVIITDSIERQEGPYQLEKRIRAFYKDMSKTRAISIARTETIFAMNDAAERSYIQSGVVQFKQFYTSRDERRCPFCASLHGKRLPVGVNYFNQGESLTVMVDGKPKTMTFNYENVSHPPVHVRCRCTILPITFMDSD